MSKIDKKILIVEDDQSYLWIIREKFVAEGFSVVTAGNGEEGLKMADEEKPDLILLDIMMPKMDGIEMAGQIKAKGLNIPIIFLTNMSDLEHMNKAIETIKADYVVKSDTPADKLVDLVKNKIGI